MKYMQSMDVKMIEKATSLEPDSNKRSEAGKKSADRRRANLLPRHLAAVGFLLVLAGCTGFTPRTSSELARIQEIDPTITENAVLAKTQASTNAILPATPSISVVRLNFTPRTDGTYNIDWPGPPRRAIQWSDVELYNVDILLDNPAPRDLTFFFGVKQDVSYWSDKDLGFVKATIRKGRTSPLPNDVFGNVADSGARAPAGAPAQAIGGFYLGCTKAGKVKGSSGRDGRQARVYIEESMLQPPRIGFVLNWESSIRTSGGLHQSPRHTVMCR